MAVNVGTLTAILGLDFSQFVGGLSQAQSKLSKLGGGMTSLGKSMTMGLTAPLVALAGISVKTAADFEVAMNQVKVATGAPSKDMKSLSKLAKKMGADTIFSAGEAADAMLELAKAGMSPAQIKAGALKSTMDLAAASGMGLAESAVVMSAGMNTFNMSAEDSTQIVDSLAGAANASAADVSDIALAMQQTGQQAVASGLSIQETTAALAAFADAGVRGSDAGTSFKTFLMRLVPSSDEAAETMKKLGLSFFDAKGNMLPLTGVAEQLKKNMKGLSQEQKLAALNTMFGSDASRAANIIMNEGAKGLQKYVDASTKSGAAAKMADARMKGLSGAIEQLKGSVETAMLTIGEKMAPTIRDIAGKLTDLANKFTALPAPIQNMIIKISLVAAAAGPLLMAVGFMVQGLSALGTAAKLAGGAFMLLNRAMMANPVMVLAVALAVAFAGLWKAAQMVDKYFGKVTGVLAGVKQGLITLVNPIYGAINAWNDLLDGLRQMGIISSKTANKLSILKGATDDGTRGTHNFAAGLDTIGTHADPAKKSIQGVGSAMSNVASTAGTSGAKAGTDFGSRAKASLDAYYAPIRRLIGNMFDPAYKSSPSPLDRLRAGLEQANIMIGGFISKVAQTKNPFTAFENKINQSINKIKKAFNSLRANWSKAPNTVAWNKLKTKFSAIIDKIKKKIEELQNKLGDLFSSLGNKIDAILEGKKLKKAIDDLKAGIDPERNEDIEEAKEQYNKDVAEAEAQYNTDIAEGMSPAEAQKAKDKAIAEALKRKNEAFAAAEKAHQDRIAEAEKAYEEFKHQQEEQLAKERLEQQIAAIQAQVASGKLTAKQAREQIAKLLKDAGITEADIGALGIDFNTVFINLIEAIAEVAEKIKNLMNLKPGPAPGTPPATHSHSHKHGKKTHSHKHGSGHHAGGMATGGIAYTPGIVNIAEKEPEVVTPFSKIPALINTVMNNMKPSAAGAQGQSITIQNLNLPNVKDAKGFLNELSRIGQSTTLRRQVT